VRAGNVCIVTLSGRFDSATANDVMTALTELIASGEKSILVDLDAVLYLTSAAFPRAPGAAKRGRAAGASSRCATSPAMCASSSR
jgi:anti-anti-sigma factor